ncbi:hypothetical protein CGLAMM_07400 [Acetobacteraceae bacterium EV16G]|uniref:Uncharacterized protein n=1 Tax=Sorlinia euscelidii TaxID=3081148 RepID=A0ABU7U2Z6_9PROT
MSESSLKMLASKLNRCCIEGIVVSERTEHITLANLSADLAREIAGSFQEVGWTLSVYDGADSACEIPDIMEALCPYRVSVQKPSCASGEILFLSTAGFRDWLNSPTKADLVVVVGLDEIISTESTQFVPYGASRDPRRGSVSFCNPRKLVREYSSKRKVPQSIECWLLSDPASWGESVQFKLWASYSTRAILLSLANEIDEETESYVFKGTPRLALKMLKSDFELETSLDEKNFENLQAAGRWVYESDREAEVRHTLFSSELARNGVGKTDAVACIKESSAEALDGAKIAYQMLVAKMSADNLKALADLRKALIEEMSKIGDASRQVAQAVASALWAVLGAVAARITVETPFILIVPILMIACIYVWTVIYTGLKFIAFQEDRQGVWRTQIYSFLSKSDFKEMVLDPSGKAASSFKIAAKICGFATTLISIGIGFIMIKAHK